MFQKTVFIACLTLLAACTETGDSGYTYLDVADVGAPDTSGGVYWVHAEPLLTKACTGCHTGGSSGGNNFASVYEDNLKPSYYCAGKTVGECVTVRIDDGTMPPGGSSSLTADERALLDAWIEAGMPFDQAGAPVEDTSPEDTATQDTATQDTAEEDVGPEDVATEDVPTPDTVAQDADTQDASTQDAGPGPTGPTYANDIQPMLATGGWCVGCHTGGSSGGSNFANVYEDNLKPSYYCGGKMVGECIVTRIDDGTMPPGGGLVISDEQRAMFEDWVTAGMPE